MTRAMETRWTLLVVLVAATQIVGVVGDVFVAPYALASGSKAWAMVAVAMNASDKNVALTLSRASSSSAAARVAVVRRCVEDVAWFAVGRLKGEDASTRRRWTTRWGALAAGESGVAERGDVRGGGRDERSARRDFYRRERRGDDAARARVEWFGSCGFVR